MLNLLQQGVDFLVAGPRQLHTGFSGLFIHCFQQLRKKMCKHEYNVIPELYFHFFCSKYGRTVQDIMRSCEAMDEEPKS